MTKRPLILVTNDDGITAPGIRSLIRVMNTLGEVVVVAPDSPQSAMGHAITINNTLYCKEEHIDNGPQKDTVLLVPLPIVSNWLCMNCWGENQIYVSLVSTMAQTLLLTSFIQGP